MQPALDSPEVPSTLQDLSAFIDKVMQDWKTPGVAVAVVRDGRIVVSRGFGMRNTAQALPVTSQTVFAIGSSTKAFTTLVLGLLVDEGKLGWDKPVRTYLPAFTMHDHVASERLTPRDLVTHRSGLPRHDLMWYGTALTRAEIVERLRYLEPNKDIRTTWQYQNLMYLTAGHLAGQLAGESWEELVTRRIFNCLGMTHANLSVTQSQQSTDHALPYQEKDDRIQEMPFRVIDTVGPAGSINASIEDMGQWLLLHLNKGMHGGERIISEEQIAQMHAPQIVMPDSGRYGEVSLPSYGLGWFIQSYRGHTVIHHGGNIDGFSALVSFMPRKNIGVVALTNLNAVPLPEVIAYHIYDRLLGLDEIDWNGLFLKDREQGKAAGKAGVEKSAGDRVEGTQPSHPLAAYVGEYAHPGYGTIAVALQGEELKADFNAFSGPLKHYHYDVFSWHYDRTDAQFKLCFATGVTGEIRGIAAPLEPLVGDIVFTRQPRREMTEKDFLARFVGEYEALGIVLNISLKGEHTLKAVLPGQPEYELEPDQGSTFRLKGLNGFSIEFIYDAAGAVIEASISQPGAVVRAPKKP